MKQFTASCGATLLVSFLAGCAPHLEGAYVDVTGAPR